MDKVVYARTMESALKRTLDSHARAGRCGQIGALKPEPTLTESLLVLSSDGVSLQQWLPGPHTEPHPFLAPPSPQGLPLRPMVLGNQVTTAAWLSPNP